MGLIHKPEKEAAAVLHRSGEDGSDAKQFDTESLIHEGWSDQNKCLQLSSDCMSPSFLRSNDPQLHDVWDLKSWNLSLDNRFFTVLSLGDVAVLDRRISVFDGSRINPLEEASLVLDRTPDDIANSCEEDLQAREVVAWLHNSLENEINESSFAGTESVESSYEHSLYEDSSVFDSSWTSFSTNEDSSSSQISDFERTSFWISLLDLEGVDSEWASDKVQGFHVFPSDFPSPSYRLNQNPHVQSPDSSIPSLIDENSGFVLPSHPASESKEQLICEGSESDIEGSDADEPLFWPFDHNSYKFPEIERDFLCVSPRRNIREVTNSDRLFSPKSIRLRLHEREGSLLQRRAAKNGCTRRIIFGARSSVSSIIGCKTIGGNNNVMGISTKPSRLSRSTKGSSDQYSHLVSMKNSPPKMKENPSPISSVEVLPSHSQSQLLGQDELQVYKNINDISKWSTENPAKIKHGELSVLTQPTSESFTADNQRFLIDLESSEEVPIEALVGLDEFSGHEGIDTEFDEGRFSLDGSL